MSSGILSKKSILSKTKQVAAITLVSRVLGLMREVLQARFLGPATALSDAFIIAFKLPSSLRKIFAEGALSAAFVPVFVGLVGKHEKEKANSLMSLTFLFFEGILMLLCLAVFLRADLIIYIFAPGFSEQQIIAAVPFLKILISFIVFISSSALLTVALNSVNHFLIPAAGSVILNIGFIGALLLCLKQGYSVEFLCYAILVTSMFVFFAHLLAYFYFNFSFSPIRKNVFPEFFQLLIKFAPVCFCMSIMEVNLALDTAFSSYLQPGTVSLMNYAFRFMSIPLGVFGVAFSTILLPHFSRISGYAPKRLGFYFLECMKFILLITVPVIFFMSLFSKQVFLTTIFMSGKFPTDRLFETQMLLIIFLLGLFFFSMNKILSNIFYSLQNTMIPTIVAIAATLFNLVFNYILVQPLGSLGLAIATTLSAIFQMILMIGFLKKRYKFDLYLGDFARFFKQFCMQFFAIVIGFTIVYNLFYYIILQLPVYLSHMLINKFAFWLWVGPLIGGACYMLIKTKKWFGVKLYFVD